jgi:hypothetical protein
VACNGTPTPKTIFFVTPMPTKLTVVYYSQKDPRWADTTLTCSNGHKSTFIHQGCGETSFAMLMSTFVDLKYTPPVVLNDFYGYGDCTGTYSSYSAKLLRDQGFTVKGAFTDIGEVKQYIKDGWLGWIHAEYYEGYKKVGHEIIVTGVDTSNNFIVNDSYYGIGSIGDPKFPYSENNITELYILKPPIAH